VNSLSNILSRLELKGKSGLIKFDNFKGLSFRTKATLKKIKPDAVYCYNDQPYFLFFDFTDEERELDEKVIHKSIWCFNQTPVVFFIKKNQIEIYNGLSFDSRNSSLKILEQESNLNNFNYWKIHSNEFWLKYKNKYAESSRVDYYLLENIENVRQLLFKSGLKRNVEVVNNLIGRLIFTRYLIDRDVNVDNIFIRGKNKVEKNNSFLELILDKKRLYGFFEYLKIKFNGDLFPLEDIEVKKIKTKHLEFLYELFNGSNIQGEIIQHSLFNFYDFSIIPIELISNIYEKFIGKVKQKANKSFYTPPFIVDYILSQTIDIQLRKQKTSICKILDPSCGSGIFLVEALRRLIEKEIQLHGKINKSDLKRIVKENIYGIDKDENAINIAIFSLYITLLDYQDPRDIESFQFPKLNETNFFNEDCFDLNGKYSLLLGKIHFDFIIGNPPWGNVKDKNHLEYCKKQVPSIPISDNQIAESFLIRVKDFSNKNTKVALVVTSKILYNLNAYKFRKYFLERFYIDKVLELSAVRRQIYENASGPSVIIFYRFAHDKNTDKNNIDHISLKPNLFLKYFKTIVIEKYDFKVVSQYYFKKYDWLWKVLLYGNIIDFYLIKRLKTLDNVNTIIKDHELIYGQGIEEGKRGKLSTTFLRNRLFLGKKDGLLERFNLNKDAIQDKWIPKNVHRNREGNEQIFRAPQLLFKIGLNSSFQAITAFSDVDLVFLKSITAIKGQEKDIGILKNLVGLFNSKLFTYYILMIGSSIGVEREQAHNKNEKFTFPVVINPEISLIVDKIKESIVRTNDGMFDRTLDFDFSLESPYELENNLNELITKIYNISEVEKDLIDYAINISIPLLNGENKPIESAKKIDLESYASIFQQHFGAIYNGPNEFFQIDVFNSNPYLFAMNFKVVEQKSSEGINFNSENNINDILKNIAGLSFNKISKNIYIQKDIKGFEENSFYVIKTNEFKNWHPAIARLDINEFVAAMKKSEIKRFNNGK
jgi:hypothetical protein